MERRKDNFGIDLQDLSDGRVECEVSQAWKDIAERFSSLFQETHTTDHNLLVFAGLVQQNNDDDE